MGDSEASGPQKTPILGLQKYELFCNEHKKMCFFSNFFFGAS